MTTDHHWSSARPHVALVAVILFGCADLTTAELSPHDPTPTKTYSGAILAYITPTGFARYAELGSRFATWAFPDDVPLSIPVGVVPSETPGPPRTIGGGDERWNVRVRAIALELTPTARTGVNDGLAARVEVSLHGEPLPVTGDLPDCRVIPGAGSRTLRIPLEVGRDVLGRIQVSVVPYGASVIDVDGVRAPFDVAAVDCASLTVDAALATIEGPLLETLLADKSFTSPLARTIATLVGAKLPSRATAVFPEGGDVSVSLVSDVSSVEPPVLVSGEALLALPFSVGVSAAASACSGLTVALPAPITSPAPEGLTWAGADLVMTLRTDALDAVIAGALAAGGLCGVAPMPIGTLADVLPSLDGPSDAIGALPEGAPVVARLAWLQAPTLTLSDAGSGLAIRLGSTSALLETFVRVGTTDHRLSRHVGPLAIDGLSPELRSDGMIGLSPPSIEQTTFEGPAGLAAQIVSQLADRLVLFPVPDRLPFKLANARFSIAGEHLVMHADFDVDGPAASPESGALSTTSEATSCTWSPMGRRSSSGWAWVTALGLIAWAVWRRARGPFTPSRR